VAKKRKSDALLPAVRPRLTAEGRRFQAEQDLGTLARAAEVRADARRLRDAKRMADEQRRALGRAVRGR